MINEAMPRGVIMETGMLYVERRGRLVSAICPYSSVGATSVKCGEWCPHFGEPGEAKLLFDTDRVDPDGEDKDRLYELHLSCGAGKYFIFHKFDDQRKIPPAGPREPDPVDVDPEDTGVPI